MDLIGVAVAGTNNAHDISAGKEQKQITSPFPGGFHTFQPAYIYSLQPVTECPFSSAKG